MKNALFILVLSLLVACQPGVNSRGNVTLEENFSSFIPGKTTTDEVLEKCGTPSLHMGNYSWIYIGLKTETSMLSEEKEIHRFIVKMTFDPNKILKSIQKIDAPGGEQPLMDEQVTDLINGNQAKSLTDKILANNH
jgi:outer membrane protein assembly factor BamE (lipoprotein component of BamABCDE complex)